MVGFVSVGPSREPEPGGDGELFAIYVLPRAWGSGAGPGLMAEAKAMLRGSDTGALLYMMEGNPRARAFYEREGWAPDGTTKADEFLGVPVREVRYRIRL